MQHFDSIVRVGHGRYGETYKAVHVPTGEQVFIKRVPIKQLISAIPAKLFEKINSIGAAEVVEHNDYLFFPAISDQLTNATETPVSSVEFEIRPLNEALLGEQACLIIAFPCAAFQASQIVRSLETPLLVWTPITLEEFASLLKYYDNDFTDVTPEGLDYADRITAGESARPMSDRLEESRLEESTFSTTDFERRQQAAYADEHKYSDDPDEDHRYAADHLEEKSMSYAHDDGADGRVRDRGEERRGEADEAGLDHDYGADDRNGDADGDVDVDGNAAAEAAAQDEHHGSNWQDAETMEELRQAERQWHQHQRDHEPHDRYDDEEPKRSRVEEDLAREEQPHRSNGRHAEADGYDREAVPAAQNSRARAEDHYHQQQPQQQPYTPNSVSSRSGRSHDEQPPSARSRGDPQQRRVQGTRGEGRPGPSAVRRGDSNGRPIFGYKAPVGPSRSKSREQDRYQQQQQQRNPLNSDPRPSGYTRPAQSGNGPAPQGQEADPSAPDVFSRLTARKSYVREKERIDQEDAVRRAQGLPSARSKSAGRVLNPSSSNSRLSRGDGGVAADQRRRGRERDSRPLPGTTDPDAAYVMDPAKMRRERDERRPQQSEYRNDRDRREAEIEAARVRDEEDALADMDRRRSAAAQSSQPPSARPRSATMREQQATTPRGPQPSFMKPTMSAARRRAKMADGDASAPPGFNPRRSEFTTANVEAIARLSEMTESEIQATRGIDPSAQDLPDNDEEAQQIGSHRQADLNAIRDNITAMKASIIGSRGNQEIEDDRMSDGHRRSRSMPRQRGRTGSFSNRSGSSTPSGGGTPRDSQKFLQAAQKRNSLQETHQKALELLQQNADRRRRDAEEHREKLRQDAERSVHQRNQSLEERVTVIKQHKESVEERLRREYEESLMERQRKIEMQKRRIELKRQAELERRQRERDALIRDIKLKKQHEDEEALAAAEARAREKDKAIAEKREKLEREKRRTAELKKREHEAKFSQFWNRRQTLEEEELAKLELIERHLKDENLL